MPHLSPIPENKVRTRNKIEQHEHCDDADARRVTLVSPDGKFKVSVIEDGGIFRLAVDANVTVGNLTVNADSDAKSGDNIAISGHKDPFIELDEKDKTSAQLSTATFTEIFSFTSTNDKLRIRTIKVKADTLGTFRVKLDGNTEDYFKTSPMERNAVFSFIEDIAVPNNSVLKVDFVAERLRLSDYNFFMRMEGYLCS